MKCKFLQQLLLMSKLLFYVLVCQVSLTGMLLANSGQAQKKTSIKDIYLSISLEDTPVEQTLDIITHNLISIHQNAAG